MHLGHDDLKFPKGFVESAKWFKASSLKGKDRVFIDKDHTWSRDAWIPYAGIQNVDGAGCIIRNRFWVNDRSSLKTVKECIHHKEIRYFVLFKDGALEEILSKIKFFDNVNQSKIVFQNDFAIIYEKLD